MLKAESRYFTRGIYFVAYSWLSPKTIKPCAHETPQAPLPTRNYREKKHTKRAIENTKSKQEVFSSSTT